VHTSVSVVGSLFREESTLTSSTPCRSEPGLDELFGADVVERNLGDDLVFNSPSDLFFDHTRTNFCRGLGAIVQTCDFSLTEGRGAGAAGMKAPSTAYTP
jgi:hypothetical protein